MTSSVSTTASSATPDVTIPESGTVVVELIAAAWLPLISVIFTSVLSTASPGNGTYATGISIADTGALNIPCISINNDGLIATNGLFEVHRKDGGKIINQGTINGLTAFH